LSKSSGVTFGLSTTAVIACVSWESNRIAVACQSLAETCSGLQ
jgi:hypothetical protein